MEAAWRLEAGGWRLEAGGWRLEAGGWRLKAQGSSLHAATSTPPTPEARHEEVEGGEGVSVGVGGGWEGVPGYLEQPREKRGGQRDSRQSSSAPRQKEAAQPSIRYRDLALLLRHLQPSIRYRHTLLYPLGKSARWQLHKVQAELRCELAGALAGELLVTCHVTYLVTSPP